MRGFSLFLVVAVLSATCFGQARPVAAATTLESAMSGAKFQLYRDERARALTAVPGMSDTMTVATFERIRATPANAALIAQLAFFDMYGVTTLNTFSKSTANRPFLRWLLPRRMQSQPC